MDLHVSYVYNIEITKLRSTAEPPKSEENMIERIHTTNRMSKIIKNNGLVYLCGQMGLGDTMTEQANDCMSRIDALLEEAGTDKSHLLQVIIWIADVGEFDEFNVSYEAWMPKGCAPTRACTQTTMAKQGMKLEMIVTATMPDQ